MLTGDPGRPSLGTRRAPALSRIATAPLDRHNVVRVLRRMQVSRVGDAEASKSRQLRGPGRRGGRVIPHGRIVRSAPSVVEPTGNRAAAADDRFRRATPGELAIPLATKRIPGRVEQPALVAVELDFCVLERAGTRSAGSTRLMRWTVRRRSHETSELPDWRIGLM